MNATNLTLGDKIVNHALNISEPRPLLHQQQLQHPQQQQLNLQQLQLQQYHKPLHVVHNVVIDALASHAGCQSCGCVHQGKISMSITQEVANSMCNLILDADLHAVVVHQVAVTVPTEVAATWANLKDNFLTEIKFKALS